MENSSKSLPQLKPLVAGFLAVDGWCLQCNWINGPSGPPKILSGGKYMTRVGGIKLALALIGRGGKAIVDWSQENRINKNGLQLRG
jgi:hypothetical protein